MAVVGPVLWLFEKCSDHINGWPCASRASCSEEYTDGGRGASRGNVARP